MGAISRACGPTFVLAGALHFVMPAAYKRMVPPYLPVRGALVYASGAAEIVGGLGLMNRTTRRPAGWWLTATLIAIFPANIHMATHPRDYPGFPGGARGLRARLPLQAVFVTWVQTTMRTGEKAHETRHG
jgi:uncharacterized membrane protein